MWRLCEHAAAVGQRVFFYGSSAGVLARLNTRLTTLVPTLKIAGMRAPPYRLLTKEEDEAVELSMPLVYSWCSWAWGVPNKRCGWHSIEEKYAA
jgi:hypothetical protein